MKKNEIPKATQNELNRKADLFSLLRRFDSYEGEGARILNELTELENSFRWFPELIYNHENCGLESITGVLMVPAEYEDLRYLPYLVESFPSISAQKGGKWGLVAIDGSNRIVTPFEYDAIAAVSGPLVPAIKKGAYGYLNVKTGAEACDFNLDKIQLYDSENTFIDGYSTFIKNGKYGLTDGGNFTKDLFDSIDMGSDDVYCVVYNGQSGYIDENGCFTADKELAAWFIN